MEIKGIRIKKINIVENEDVYDLQVYNNHNFFANNILVKNCGEIPLTKYDSCRLLAINLYSYVKNPFTKDAYFDYELFKSHSRIAQRLMDDMIDLEIEKLDRIISNISENTDPLDTKKVEIAVWEKIKDKAIKGRRTGLGITAEGDMLAALGIKYGTSEATDFSENIHKMMSVESYKSSIEMAKERGAFPDWSYEKEQYNPFLNRVIEEMDYTSVHDYTKYGRRNISNLTIAPTGSVSMLTQTTSGIEPVFLPFYKRRKKTEDKNKAVFTDEQGDMWEEFNVFHHKFVEWFMLTGYKNSNINESEVKDYKVCMRLLQQLSEEDLNEFYKISPYYGATSNDVNYLEKVNMQGRIQKWVDHSISVTVNMPTDVTEQTVAEVYLKAWESGCKGITVYRDGCRTGVLLSNKEKKEDDIKFKPVKAHKRPKDVPCDIYFVKVRGEQFIVMVGILDGHPYEVFSFKIVNQTIDNTLKKGILSKRKSGCYDLISLDKKTVLVEDLSSTFETPNEEDRTRLISGWLRSRGNIKYVVDILNKSKGDLTMFSKVIARILKKYIADGEKSSEKCPHCGSALVFEEGCLNCKNCGHSKCG